ncbi:MAG: glycosyl hydrolase, partial [Gemmatimonadetes bacterium]|nr:glycosyl hydrolase [Gemmatimonadota bacterium]
MTSEVPVSALKALHWRSIGPFRGGRAVAVAGHPTDRLVFYQGSTGGGVWKTVDGGYRWTNVTDGYVGTGSVGAIAVAESNPDIVYVGMGETCLRGNLSHGDGVYRSPDGGRTWTRLGLEETRHIGRIRVHPRSPDVVYVAALGHAWGPNPERGVYRSRDGGKTWDKVLFVNDETGAVDLVIHPADPRTLYATTWQARRYPWGQRMAGPGSGIYKSTDGGDTWREITRNPGLPTGTNRGRIGIALSPARPERVWVVMSAEGEQSGVYRSDDGGITWRLTSDRFELTERPFYYNHIVADPRDPETVYVLATQLWKSSDGGASYQTVATPHGDNHDLWIDPRDPLRIAEANDGGATVSFDGGKSWSTLLNQPTAQLYHVAADNGFPYRVYANQQDNTTISVPSRSDYGGIGASEWYTVGGHEDGYTVVRPDDPNIVYSGDHYWLTRYDHRTHQVKYISPWNEIYWGWGARDLKYRFQWVFPVVVSPHRPNVLYATSQYVHRSGDEGDSWEIISPDLTRADPKTLEPTPSWGESEDTGPYWGPLRRENTGIEWYATIFAFAESPVRADVLWAGSDDGLIHVSRDGGKHWENVTPPELGEFALVSIVEASPHDAASAYVAATRYKL